MKVTWIASIQNVCEFHHNSNNPTLFITEFSNFHTTFFILKHTHFQYSNLGTRVNSVRDFRVTVVVIHRKPFLTMQRTQKTNRIKTKNTRNRHQPMLWKLEMRINNHISAKPTLSKDQVRSLISTLKKTELKLTHTISNKCDAPGTQVFLIQHYSNLFNNENPIQLYVQPNHFKAQFEIFIQRYSNSSGEKKKKPIDVGKTLFLFVFSCCFFFFFLGLAFVLVPFGLWKCHSSKASSFVAIFLGSSCGSLLLYSFTLPVREKWFNWTYWQMLGHIKPRPWSTSIPTWALISGQIL